MLAVTSSLVVLDCLRHQIKRLEQTVHKRLHHTPSYEQLLTVQGIGTILAQTITLETGAISRFPTGGTMPRIAAVWTARRSAMASAKARAMSKMATRIWRGPIWRQRSLPCVSAGSPALLPTQAGQEPQQHGLGTESRGP